MAADNQSLAEPIPEPALLALARKKFGALSDAEEELFRAAQEGRDASAFADDEKENDPAHAANWPAERAVRAACITWACTDPQASVLVTYKGLELHGMRIEGELDLSYAEIKFSLRAWKCAFSENICLQDAQLRGFYLVDCEIQGLNAIRALISSSVFLHGGVKAKGEVNLRGIRIGGDLECSGAQFSRTKGVALSANGAKIEGNIFLRNGFKAEGEVNLQGTKIGGDLDCDGAQFLNGNGLALTANTAKIERNLFLRDGFRAEGEVNLVSATIGKSLDCKGAQFSNVKGLALTAGGATIEGSVFLRQGFSAEGEVNLVAAKIDGDLDCSGAQFSHAERLALVANVAKIEGRVFLCDGLKAEGEISLEGATIGGNLQLHDILEAKQIVLNLRLTQVKTLRDDEGSWPNAENLLLDGFRYERLYETAPFEADSRKKWLSLQPRDKFRPQPYEQLAGVLRQMGHEPEARQIMVEKNRERARFTEFPHQSWWWYNLFGKLIGYGYRPWRAFAMSVAMILLGTILFYVGSTHGLISPTSENAYEKAPSGQVIEENEPKKISEEYPVFNAFVYSLESFVPLLKLDQSANWTPNANRSTEISIFCRQVLVSRHVPFPGRFLRYYLYFHIAAGWLLTSLWVGAITGLVKT